MLGKGIEKMEIIDLSCWSNDSMYSHNVFLSNIKQSHVEIQIHVK